MANGVGHIVSMNLSKEADEYQCNTTTKLAMEDIDGIEEKHHHMAQVIETNGEAVNIPQTLTDDNSRYGAAENQSYQYCGQEGSHDMLESENVRDVVGQSEKCSSSSQLKKTGITKSETNQDSQGTNTSLRNPENNGREDRQPGEIEGTANGEVPEGKDCSGGHTTETSSVFSEKAETAIQGTDNKQEGDFEVSGEKGTVVMDDNSTVNRRPERSMSPQKLTLLEVKETSEVVSTNAAGIATESEKTGGDADQGSSFKLINSSESNATKNENTPEGTDPRLQFNPIPDSLELGPIEIEKVRGSDDISGILRSLSQTSLIGYPDEDEWSTRLQTLREIMEKQTTQAQKRREIFQRRKQEIVVRQNKLIEAQLQHRNLGYRILPKIESNNSGSSSINLQVPENFPVVENGLPLSSNDPPTPSRQEDPFIVTSLESKSQTTF